MRHYAHPLIHHLQYSYSACVSRLGEAVMGPYTYMPSLHLGVAPPVPEGAMRSEPSGMSR